MTVDSEATLYVYEVEADIRRRGRREVYLISNLAASSDRYALSLARGWLYAHLQHDAQVYAKTSTWAIIRKEVR